MHRTQSHIMQVLLGRSPRRYSELKPKDVEGNVFMYHIRRMIKEGLIEKVDDVYALTTAGGLFVSHLSRYTQKPRVQPRVLVEVACKNENGEWLLRRNFFEPFPSLVGFPAGRLHIGERVIEAAEREHEIKTGFRVKATHVGNIYMATYKKGELLSHLLTHVCLGEITGGEMLPADESGECYWGNPTEEEMRGPGYFPGLADVVWHLKHRPTDGQFFGEYEYLA